MKPPQQAPLPFTETPAERTPMTTTTMRPGATAEPQRIHPVDVEAAAVATAPLVPGDLSRSDKGDPDRHYTRHHRAVPLPVPRKRRSCCCRLLCCALCSLVLLAVAAAAALGILYLVFDPKLPSYSVDRLRVSAFSVDAALTARATFEVTVTAMNPNKGIGIFYEPGARLRVRWTGYDLCEGTLPAFYQGHRNTTVLPLQLAGAVRLGSAVAGELQQQQLSGAVPLRFQGDVPVRVKVGALKLWRVTSRVVCDLVVDSLSASSVIRIKNSSCRFSLKL